MHLNILQDSELVALLKDARNCVNILNENLTLFVKVILVRTFNYYILTFKVTINVTFLLDFKMDEQK